MTRQIQRPCCRHRTTSILVVWILMPLAILVASPLAAQTYAGRAFGAYVNAPTLGAPGVYLSDTGPLSAEGGWQGAGSIAGNVPAVISSDVLNATTSGSSGTAGGFSSLADVVVFQGQPAELKASFVQAQSTAGLGGASASIEVDDLTLGGLPVSVTGLPNQVVSLPGVATLIINEQTTSADGNSAVVNALRLTLVTGDEVTLAGATSKVNPAGLTPLASLSTESRADSTFIRSRSGALWKRWRILPVWNTPECFDFVTGGGFFEPPHSYKTPPPGRVNFGFNAGSRSAQNPTLKGELNLVDHATDDHVQGTTVDVYYAYNGDPDHCRVFEGDAKFDGASGYRYKAFVCDYGEPGRDDRFAISVTLGGSEVYFADNIDVTPPPQGGELDGGNIQLHKPKCQNSNTSNSNQTSELFPVVRPTHGM